jgi:hypothetical protein
LAWLFYQKHETSLLLINIHAGGPRPSTNWSLSTHISLHSSSAIASLLDLDIGSRYGFSPTEHTRSPARAAA